MLLLFRSHRWRCGGNSSCRSRQVLRADELEHLAAEAAGV